MNTKVAVKDAFLHAIEIEKLGAALYGKLEEKSSQDSLKKIFNKLKKAETFHIEKFQQLYQLLESEANERGISLTGGGNETEILKDKVFNRVQSLQQLINAQSPYELLNHLVNLELDVINYYTHLQHFILPKEQQFLMKIINEEKDHVKELIRERNRFKKSSM